MTQEKTPKIISQYINSISMERYDIDNNDLSPNIDISGDLEVQGLSTDTPKIIIDLSIQISYKSQQAMSLTLQYIGVIKKMGADIPTLNSFLYLEYPPILLMELRQIVANITSAAGIHQVLIDPWDWSRQFAKQLEANNNL